MVGVPEFLSYPYDRYVTMPWSVHVRVGTGHLWRQIRSRPVSGFVHY